MKLPHTSFIRPALWLAPLMLCACVTPQAAWRKDGINPHDTHTALAQCRYEIGMNHASAERKKQLLADCMQARGFRWRTY